MVLLSPYHQRYLPWQLLQRPENQALGSLHLGFAWLMFLITISWLPGWRHSQKCHFVCGIILHGEQQTTPHHRWRWRAWKTFISLYRSFKNDNDNSIKQKALPSCMLREVAKNLSTKTKQAISQLPIGGFFFTCRSYTYVLVPQAERNRTDILRLRNFFFFKDGIELKQDNPQLEFADCVSIILNGRKGTIRWVQSPKYAQVTCCFVKSESG